MAGGGETLERLGLAMEDVLEVLGFAEEAPGVRDGVRAQGGDASDASDASDRGEDATGGEDALLVGLGLLKRGRGAVAGAVLDDRDEALVE